MRIIITQSSWSSPITYIIWILGPLQVPLLDHNNQTVTRDTTPPPGKRTLRSKLWVKFENKQHRNENKRQPRWMAFECAYPHEEVRVHYSYYIHTVCNPDVKGASLGPLHHPLNHHHHHRHRHHQPRDLLQSLQPQQQQPMMPIENELCLADINLSLWCNCASHFDVSVSGWWIAQTNIEESSFQSNRDRGTAGRYKYLHSVLDKGLESTPPFPFHVQAVSQSVPPNHKWMTWQISESGLPPPPPPHPLHWSWWCAFKERCPNPLSGPRPIVTPDLAYRELQELFRHSSRRWLMCNWSVDSMTM